MPFSVFLLTGFLRTLPKELEDAARIDGASEFRIFWTISCR
jgi:ABC-type glycerol-3-phosphate transport system permease component